MTYLSKTVMHLLMKMKVRMMMEMKPTHLPAVVVKGCLGVEWIGL